ncbi:hypothetical protein L7F22_026696 [Adiantum nelumboides]|nr:hypothetical protein [Adiantum nelumboides]
MATQQRHTLAIAHGEELPLSILVLAVSSFLLCHGKAGLSYCTPWLSSCLATYHGPGCCEQRPATPPLLFSCERAAGQAAPASLGLGDQVMAEVAIAAGGAAACPCPFLRACSLPGGQATVLSAPPLSSVGAPRTWCGCQGQPVSCLW